MTVRRLAEAQPESFAFTPENAAWTKTQIAKYPPGRQASAVIALLWRAQAQHDYWLPKAAMESVADMLGMPYIRVLEIATFYSMYNLQPVGKFFVQVCGTTPCMLRGSDDLRAVCEKRIGPAGHVSADGFFAWTEVECLGACCNAPMVQINDDYYEDLTAESFASLLEAMAAGHPVTKGSQTGRASSEPDPHFGTTLSDPALYDGSAVGAWRKRFDEEAAKAGEAAQAKAESAAAPPSPPPASPSPPPSPPPVAEAPPVTPAPAATEPPPAISAPAAEASAAAPEPPAAGLADAGTIALEAKSAEEERTIAEVLSKLPDGASLEDRANAVGTKPPGIEAARGGKPDNLQAIRGIGEVNETKLNGLGIFHFDQIADWDRQEIRWVGTFLAFPGRIDREDWVGQAKVLAAGSLDAAGKTG